jgi:DnaK suppressor protein
MNAEKIGRFRNLLKELEAELREGLEAGDETAPVKLDTSIGRLSRMDAIQSQQMALALKERQRVHLMRVEKALEAIDRGMYGKCRRCGGEISEDRLEAQPDAVLCIQCAAKAGR